MTRVTKLQARPTTFADTNRCWIACGIWLAPLILLSGCAGKEPEIKLLESRQTAVFCLSPSDAFYEVVDADGNSLRMPDGLRIVVENQTVEKEIEPRDPSRDKDMSRLLRVFATFEMQRQSLVVDVVPGPDGEASEVSHTYWVIRIQEVRSVRLVE